MKLTETFLDKYRDVEPKWGYGTLGWIIYQRTYSRPLPEGGYEKWWQTVRRVVEGVYRAQFVHCEKNGLPWSAYKAQISAQKMYDMIFSFKFLPPGRGLWAMGTKYVEERGSAPLNNCAFITTAEINKDFSYPFCFLMDMSMLGVGVGSDTRGAGLVTIKVPELSETDQVIPDTREGWVDSVRTILDAHVGVGTLPKLFDYSQIRAAGTSIQGFGGVSAGSAPLRVLHESLLDLLSRFYGKPISSSAIVDLFNLIGRAVVAGGIRRTAEIMLGDPDDTEFINLKDPKLWPKEVMSHRWASNNSLIVKWGTDYSKFVDQIMANGEPGFFWIDNARMRRRMKEKKGDHDPYVMGQNPCGEISLESGEFCNLVEVYPAHHDSWEDFKTTLKWAYLYAKSVSLIPTHNRHTNAIIGRNRRLGVSVSGVTQAISRHGTRTFFRWLDDGYDELRRMDALYSRWLCVPQSIKLTTVKPSGTVSLLAGATPGVHLPHSEYYIRNVRFDPFSPLLDVLRRAGYPVEKSVANDNTFVVSFPIHEKHFIKGKAQASVWEQFELAAQMQYWWADNSVSVTVTVAEEEAKDLPRILELYETRLKSVAILPLKDHGYKQAPYITLHKEEYERMMAGISPIEGLESISGHDVDEVGCTTDTCSII
jgi:ribonucleoside-triphosphate reductase